MNDSNWTLRFPRTAREAYGHDIKFDDEHFGYKWAGVFVAFVWGIVVGLWFGGVL